MSREHIERVGRDADDATAARPDYAPIAAFAGAFSGCLTTLNLVAFGLEPYERSSVGGWWMASFCRRTRQGGYPPSSALCWWCGHHPGATARRTDHRSSGAAFRVDRRPHRL